MGLNNSGCGVCGGTLVEIRGRYPDDPKRSVCPTCLADRMDLIREMSARDYGVAYENTVPSKPVTPA